MFMVYSPFCPGIFVTGFQMEKAVPENRVGLSDFSAVQVVPYSVKNRVVAEIFCNIITFGYLVSKVSIVSASARLAAMGFFDKYMLSGFQGFLCYLKV
jgi:hypothetical protein